MERYKDYKIPLMSLRTGSLVKNLVKAGSRIIVTPQQAKRLSTMKDMLEISETQTPTIDESQVRETMETTDNEAFVDLTENVSESLDMSEEDGIDFDGEEEKPTKKSRKKASPLTAKDAMEELMGKFVNVTDVVPPLPQKGDFKVEMIKKSQYFFS